MMKDIKKQKLAIFDLDGTLFDTRKANFCAYRDALKQFGYALDYDYYCSFCNGRYYKDFLPKISTTDEDILNRIHSLKKKYYSTYLNEIIPNYNLINVVKLLRNEFYTAVVTSASNKNCNELLEHFCVLDYFDKIITHDDVVNKKPNPEGFIKAMEFFGIDCQNTVIFEDSDTGIEAAKKSGANYYIVAGYN